VIHWEDFIYRSVFCGLCPAITQTQKNSDVQPCPSEF